MVYQTGKMIELIRGAGLKVVVALEQRPSEDIFRMEQLSKADKY